MKLLSLPALPVVSSLPTAGTLGRLVTLSTDGHCYHDNGTSWDDLSAATGGSVTLSDVIVYAIALGG